MGFGRWVGRVVKALLAPSLLLCLSAFFIWHAQHGDRGLITRELRQAELEAAREALEAAKLEHAAAARRVNAMRGAALDRDQLEERARSMLNLTQPHEIVIPYQQGRRLY